MTTALGALLIGLVVMPGVFAAGFRAGDQQRRGLEQRAVRDAVAWLVRLRMDSGELVDESGAGAGDELVRAGTARALRTLAGPRRGRREMRRGK